MALGASSGQVVWLVLRQSLGMIAAGVALGGIATLVTGPILHRLVEGAGAIEPSTFAVMLPLLIGAALLASYLPARRASRLDPLNALRQD
jgi:putative ABC transport system permease protein